MIRPTLIVVTDTEVAPFPLLEERIERTLASARPGSVLVQLRDPTLPLTDRRALGERLVALCRRHGQFMAVNDRIDLAVLLGADGVHLGERSVAPAEARSLLPAGAFVSHACHDVAAVILAGSDAALLSPIVAPRKGRPALGTAALGRARSALDEGCSTQALYALGGVDAATAAECVASGATGVAVIGAALDGRDVRPLLSLLGIAR